MSDFEKLFCSKETMKAIELRRKLKEFEEVRIGAVPIM